MKKVWIIILWPASIILFTIIGIFIGFKVGRIPYFYIVNNQYAFNTDLLLSKISDYRISQGLGKLDKSDRDCQVAALRLLEIEKKFSHEGFSAKRFCGNSACNIGENLSQGFSTEQQVLNAWIASSTHQKTMAEKEYRYGCVEFDGTNTVLTLSDVNSF